MKYLIVLQSNNWFANGFAVTNLFMMYYEQKWLVAGIQRV